MRAVLDTNVLISGVIATGVPHKLLVKGFNHEYQIVVSVETLNEFRETLLKYPERFHMDEDEVKEEVKYLGGRSKPRGFTVLSMSSRNGRMDAGEFQSP
ncbi:PIN domain-containing protein [Haloquadratum walsbyi]|jgi:predicted nucleic acid-binding protein|uniref:PIN domain-containing protein n=1 Tax=Haloquadratum walsbyi TaxID=293091 RepID=UPI0009823F42|nr:PIN domain-containing protein [Haloquadratum walsbyi]